MGMINARHTHTQRERERRSNLEINSIDIRSLHHQLKCAHHLLRPLAHWWHTRRVVVSVVAWLFGLLSFPKQPMQRRPDHSQPMQR
jgi:hypothetical protein